MYLSINGLYARELRVACFWKHCRGADDTRAAEKLRDREDKFQEFSPEQLLCKHRASFCLQSVENYSGHKLCEKWCNTSQLARGP